MDESVGEDESPALLTTRKAVDSEVDLRDPRQLRLHSAQVLATIAAGGVVGAAARQAVSLGLPTAEGGLPWATLLVNVSGCLLIGVLMVLIVEARPVHQLVRPFLGVGVLGGYTTFSTYTVEVQVLIVAGRPELALGYLTGTAAAALVAVRLGIVLTRFIALPQPRGPSTRRNAPHGETR